MSTPKPTRAVKAWAVLTTGRIDAEIIFPWKQKFRADDWCVGWRTRRVIPVLITPLTSEEKK